MIYLLDTDHVSDLQSLSQAGRRLAIRLRRVPPDDYGTSIISFEEQMRGRLTQVASSGPASSQSVFFYALLNTTLRFYSNIAVWQYSEAAIQRLEVLLRAKPRVGTQDLKIASVALAAGATLLTRNTRDFAKIPGLLSEDWT